jgi:cytochrome c556
LASVMLSCAGTPRQRYETRCQKTPEPALHAVQSDRLRELMNDLDRLAPGDWPQEMDPAAEREARIAEFAEVVRDMATTANHLPSVLEGVRIAPEDRVRFVRLADRMRDEATGLEKLALRRDVASMETALDNSAATCKACHSAFRVLPMAFAEAN